MSDITYSSRFKFNLFEEDEKPAENKQTKKTAYEEWEEEGILSSPTENKKSYDGEEFGRINFKQLKKERKVIQREVAIEILYCFGEEFESGNNQSLNKFKNNWIRQSGNVEGELGKKQFITVILELLKKNRSNLISNTEGELQTVSSLSEVFDEIDFNNTEGVLFVDFVSFLISVAKSTDEVSWFKKYKFKRTMNTAGGEENVQKLKYIPIWEKFVVCGRTKKVKVINPVDKQVEYVLMDHDGAILTCEYIREHNMFVTSSADLAVRFWDCNNDLRKINYHDCRMTGSQTVLTWSSYHNRLLSASRTGKLLIWKREERTRKTYNTKGGEDVESKLEKESIFVTNEEKAIPIHQKDCRVMDMLIKPNQELVTCGLDSVINIWDTRRGSKLKKGELGLIGDHCHHKKGVFSISWSEEHSFLISGGFETEAFVWISNVDEDLFKLRDQRRPHNTSIVHVEVIPNSPQIITADIKGMVKIWDIRTFQCLQTFFFDQQMKNDVSLHSLCYISKTKEIVTAGKRVCVFEYERTKNPHHSSDENLVYARYNAEVYSFITASKSEIRIWDAFSGKLVKCYDNLTKSEITSCCLDEIGRKFFIGTHSGEVFCYQFSNGEFVKKYTLDPRLQKEEEDIRSGKKKKKDKISVSDYYMNVHTEGKKSQLQNQKVYEVTSLTYCSDRSCDDKNKAKKIVATTWQKGVFILNDNDPEEGTISQKFVTSKNVTYHTSDVKCSDYSRYLHYIVTGDESSSVFVWELNSTSKKNLATFSKGMTGEITCVKFLVGYEAFVCGDSTGYLHLWRVRQLLYCACSWRNYNDSRDYSTPVTAIEFDPQTKYLYTGDEHGFVEVWDIEKVMLQAALKPIRSSSMNMKMKKKRGKKRKVRPEEAQRQHFWKAHSKAIKNVQLVINPLCLITSSENSEVKIWSLSGEFKDCLRQELTEKEEVEGRIFNFPVQKKYEEAKDKFKVATAVLDVHKKLVFMKKWIALSENIKSGSVLYQKKLNRRLYGSDNLRRESEPLKDDGGILRESLETFITEKQVRKRRKAYIMAKREQKKKDLILKNKKKKMKMKKKKEKSKKSEKREGGSKKNIENVSSPKRRRKRKLVKKTLLTS